MYNHSCRSLLGSPAPSSSRPPSLTFHRREDFSLSGPLSTSGYPRDVTCPATLLHVQPYILHVSSATCSVTSPPGLATCFVTSPSGFLQGLLTNLRWPVSQFLLPASWLHPSRLLLTQTSSCVIRPPCCVGCIFLPHAIHCKTLYTHGQYQSKECCISAVTVHVCAVKKLHATYLGLKINNFVIDPYHNKV